MDKKEDEKLEKQVVFAFGIITLVAGVIALFTGQIGAFFIGMVLILSAYDIEKVLKRMEKKMEDKNEKKEK
jgi:uncharacterized membrane protein